MEVVEQDRLEKESAIWNSFFVRIDSYINELESLEFNARELKLAWIDERNRDILSMVDTHCKDISSKVKPRVVEILHKISDDLCISRESYGMKDGGSNSRLYLNVQYRLGVFLRRLREGDIYASENLEASRRAHRLMKCVAELGSLIDW